MIRKNLALFQGLSTSDLTLPIFLQWGKNRHQFTINFWIWVIWREEQERAVSFCELFAATWNIISFLDQILGYLESMWLISSWWSTIKSFRFYLPLFFVPNWCPKYKNQFYSTLFYWIFLILYFFFDLIQKYGYSDIWVVILFNWLLFTIFFDYL